MQTATEWMADARRWFATHPDREFRWHELPLGALPGTGTAGWIAGALTAPPVAGGGAAQAELPEGADTFPVLIRRPDAARGRPLPGVFVLDGGATLPPAAILNDPAGAEDAGADLWGLVQAADAIGLSVRALAARQAAPECLACRLPVSRCGCPPVPPPNDTPVHHPRA